MLLGWNPGTDEEFFTLDDLKQRFTIEGLSKAPAVFDPNKLNLDPASKIQFLCFAAEKLAGSG